MKDRSIRTFTRLAALTVALMLLVSCAAAEAVDSPAVDPYLELSTQYPAMTVKAGDSLTFALEPGQLQRRLAGRHPFGGGESRRAGRAPSAPAASRSAWSM